MAVAMVDNSHGCFNPSPIWKTATRNDVMGGAKECIRILSSSTNGPPKPGNNGGGEGGKSNLRCKLRKFL